MFGKLAFLFEYSDFIPKIDLQEDKFAFLVYLSRKWGWPIWLVALFAAPKVSIRRFKKRLNKIKTILTK